MKKIIYLIAFFITLIPLDSLAFSDIENSWYKSSIMKLKTDGIVNWFEDGDFHPDSNITRAEMLSIILNSSETEIINKNPDSCFPDLVKGSWYIKYICYAHENDITNGYLDGNFRPNWNVSMIELLALWLKTYGISVPKDTSKPWYESYIAFADENNIIPKNAYTINSPAKRWQASNVVVRIQQLKQNKTLNYNSNWCSSPKNLSDKNPIIVNDKNRSYLLNLPNNYNSKKSYPVYIGLHGRTNSNQMVMDYMWIGGWRRDNSSEVISVYPAGLWEGPYTWHQSENIDFIDAMLYEISESLCIDKSQINIVWHSLWAYMSNKLSCLRWDRISTMTAVAWPWYLSECSWPVASLILHNKDDKLVAYSGWKKAVEIRKSINDCKWESTSVNISGFNCQQWSQCSAWNPVTFCTEYSTYWDVPHSRPKKGSQVIFKNIDNLWR